MRLTTPSTDIGAAAINVDGRQVGHILGEFYGWRAYLWPEPDLWPYPHSREEVYARGRLRDLRTQLRQRLDESGPWWAKKESNQ
jgi:hypothetical protein